MINAAFSRLKAWFFNKPCFVKMRRKKYAHMVVGGNPAGYYIESIKGMCSIWQKSIDSKRMSKEDLGTFMHQLLKAREKYYLEEAYDAIDHTIHSMYEYSKEMGFVDENISLKVFKETTGATVFSNNNSNNI